MKKLLRNKKGNMYVWIVFFVSVMMFGVLFVTLHPFRDTGMPIMAESVGINVTDPNDGAGGVFNTINSIADATPLAALLGLFIAAVAYSQRDQFGTRFR